MAIAVIGRLVGPQFSAGDKAARLNKLWKANLVLNLALLLGTAVTLSPLR